MDFHTFLSQDEIEECRAFADKSAYSQREYRSGGTQIRATKQVIEDTFRGKIGEFIAKIFLKSSPLNLVGIKIDLGIYPRGRWDRCDFKINNISFSIKSVKHFSKWLLIESNDLERKEFFDYYILVAVDENHKGGIIQGFTSLHEILNDTDTLKLKKGEFIPGTRTSLDADNHGRHKDFLHNEENDWLRLVEEVRGS